MGKVKAKKIALRSLDLSTPIIYDSQWLVTPYFILHGRYINECINDKEIVQRVRDNPSENFRYYIGFKTFSSADECSINYQVFTNPDQDRLSPTELTHWVYHSGTNVTRVLAGCEPHIPIHIDDKYTILLELADTYKVLPTGEGPIFLYREEELIGVVSPMRVKVDKYTIARV